MTRENWQQLEEQGLIFDEKKKHKPFNMNNCLCMDIETCSLINTGWRFLVHNVGWGHALDGRDIATGELFSRGHVKELVAQSESELATSKVLWQALQEWQDIAVTLKENELGDTLFIYAHNNAKFDGVAVMHSILSSTNTPCDDMLESNGKFISFRWKNLVFRDSMLIATSSLAEAAKAYGIKHGSRIFPIPIPKTSTR